MQVYRHTRTHAHMYTRNKETNIHTLVRALDENEQARLELTNGAVRTLTILTEQDYGMARRKERKRERERQATPSNGNGDNPDEEGGGGRVRGSHWRETTEAQGHGGTNRQNAHTSVQHTPSRRGRNGERRDHGRGRCIEGQKEGAGRQADR